MSAFLEQVAHHYFSTSEVEKICFIFPTRRSVSFFLKYLAEEVAADGTRPVTAPVTLTISDFFFQAAGYSPTDRLTLLLDLYEDYTALFSGAEPLDDFIFWGDIILEDFDDVDKYLVNAGVLFSNVSDFKSLQDNYSYMTPVQEEAVRRFVSHFRKGEEVTADKNSPKDVKGRFLKIWDILGSLYERFNGSLDAKGHAYEGKVYRALVDRLGTESVKDILEGKFSGTEKFVFTGLNALNECERKVMRRMRDAGIAEFCWDYRSEMIRNKDNRSSHFMSVNTAEFPQAFESDSEGLPETSFNVLSVPSGTGQAKQIPAILARMGKNPGIDTAIVLPEENLLIPVLNTIPPQVKDINVTMGYPMEGSELWSLLNDISAMQMHLRFKDGRWWFYHKQVWAVFSNSVFRTVLDEESAGVVEQVKKETKYYIPVEDLQKGPVLSAVFKPVVRHPDIADPACCKEIGYYQMDVLRTIAPGLKSSRDMALELDFAKVCYEAIEQLTKVDLPVLPSTYFRLLSQILAKTSVPFKGEPLKGLQIMGPLETRALDFENLIILSCNEGAFPRRSISSSFIPPELRRGFGLPTYEYQDAVWAYYFYRMIQRARNVWMVFDSRTEGLRGGEMSRYIRQLEMHFKVPVQHFVVNSPIRKAPEPEEIAKTDEDISLLHRRPLSATSLQDYLCCPVKFYFRSVCRLKEQNDVAESLDAGMFGKVFHKTMESLYSGRKTISRAYMEGLLKNRKGLEETVSGFIREEIHSIDISGRNIISRDLICRYVAKTLQRDIELTDSYGTGGFDVIGLERKEDFEIGGFPFTGTIDRLDSFSPDEIRVVDYKTGKVSDDEFIIDEGNAEKVVSDLFDSEKNARRPKIALQLYLYDRLASGLPECSGKTIVNSIYRISSLFVSEIQSIALNGKFCSLMSERLDGLLNEISDTSIPWGRTSDVDSCAYCKYRMICGR